MHPPIPPPPPSRRTADLALLLGLLSLAFTFVAGIPAVVLGVRALRVADAVGGRGRARAGIALGAVTTAVAVVVLAVLGVRLVDGARDVGAPAGSERAQQRAQQRAAVDDAALVRATGLPLEQLQGRAGVTLTHDPGSTVDCVDSCSSVELAVTGQAAVSGPLAREVLLARLQAYRDATGGAGCGAADPARPCRLRDPAGATLVLRVEAGRPDYVLRIE